MLVIEGLQIPFPGLKRESEQGAAILGSTLDHWTYVPIK